jgi:hypothetical protein
LFPLGTLFLTLESIEFHRLLSRSHQWICATDGSIHFSLDRYEKGPWAEVNYQCAVLLEGWPVVHLDADARIRYASLDIS